MGRACRVKERSDWHRICKICVLALKKTRWQRFYAARSAENLSRTNFAARPFASLRSPHWQCCGAAAQFIIHHSSFINHNWCRQCCGVAVTSHSPICARACQALSPLRDRLWRFPCRDSASRALSPTSCAPPYQRRCCGGHLRDRHTYSHPWRVPRRRHCVRYRESAPTRRQGHRSSPSDVPSPSRRRTQSGSANRQRSGSLQRRPLHTPRQSHLGNRPLRPKWRRYASRWHQSNRPSRGRE